MPGSGKVAPKKRFGQNFLKSQFIIDRIVRAIKPDQADLMIEIGPGQGAITDQLSDRVKDLHLIEIDRDLAHALTLKFSHRPNITIHQQDALNFDLSTLSIDEQASIRVVGNLPYNISTPLLFHLIKYAPFIRDMHFMLQYEVVKRMCATPGTKEYGRLTVMIQYYCLTRLLFKVPPEAFFPRPKVTSAVISLIPHPVKPIKAIDEQHLTDLVRDAFTQRRKTLANALKQWLPMAEYEVIGIDPQLRPDHLSTEQFVKISNHCQTMK